MPGCYIAMLPLSFCAELSSSSSNCACAKVDEAEVMGQPPGPASGLTAMLAGGAPLPDVQVQVLDQWENPTHPIPEMPYQLKVTSPALEPNEQHFKFLPTGITTVTGEALMPG